MTYDSYNSNISKILIYKHVYIMHISAAFIYLEKFISVYVFTVNHVCTRCVNICPVYVLGQANFLSGPANHPSVGVSV